MVMPFKEYKMNKEWDKCARWREHKIMWTIDGLTSLKIMHTTVHSHHEQILIEFCMLLPCLPFFSLTFLVSIRLNLAKKNRAHRIGQLLSNNGMWSINLYEKRAQKKLRTHIYSSWWRVCSQFERSTSVSFGVYSIYGRHTCVCVCCFICTFNWC